MARHIGVERALILLRYIVENPEGLSIREVGRELGYSPATVQKLVNALSAQSFVIQDEETQRYHLGPGAVQLGLAALSRLEVRRIAHPHLEALSRETGETTFLGIAGDSHAVYVDKVVSSQPIRMDAPLGVDRPYNCTAIGKVLLTAVPEERLEELANDGAFERRTERSICEVDALRREIQEVRQRGWACDDEEYVSGARCVAGPIRDHRGDIVAALTVSGPARRVEDRLDWIVERVRASAKAASEQMGYRGVAKTLPRTKEQVS